MKKFLALVMALCMVLSIASFAGAEEIKNLNTYETQARELETWNIHYSQAAADLNVLTNCYDGLLTNDNHGNLKANAAASYGTEDGGKVKKTIYFFINIKAIDVEIQNIQLLVP